MPISDQQKKQIIQQNIQNLEQEQYSLEVRARVMKSVGDDTEDIVKVLEKNQKMQDAYQKELEEIGTE